jgi:type 1 glutamine amidotransferase
MDRRSLLKNAGLAALALGAGRLPCARAEEAKKRILVYTRSQGFEHGSVKRKGTDLSLAERIATKIGSKHNIEVVCEKDGRVFLSREFPSFDGFLFQTQGDLCAEKSVDGTPPMPPDGKKALLDAVHSGKGFAGCHCASDTFHSRGEGFENQAPEKRDPYIAMLGGEFIRHGAQQAATMHVADPDFPGIKGQKDFRLMEEWYSLKNFAPDLHVILVQETKGMKDHNPKHPDYARPDFPATWARVHGKGRVFFTSMGHREDVWENPIFQTLLTGALAWTLGRVDADLTPNFEKACPNGSELPVQQK